MPNILENFNLEIQSGEKIAIVGASGRGKSTLLKLLIGLLQPNCGEILINNLPITSFGINNYLDKIAVVLQEDHLLSGTILDNISFFNDNIDFTAIEDAAKTAQIHQTISNLPLGYHTLIGDSGAILSGGQKQRLLLARALYRKPQILFLDEATSHLDNANEIAINQQLKNLPITQVIIAHRQETIAMADRVVEL